MSILRVLQTTPWPAAPDIRGQDMAWIAALSAAGLAILFAATTLLTSLVAGTGMASAPDLEAGSRQTAHEFWMQLGLIGAFYGYLAALVYGVLIRPQRQSWRDLGFRHFHAKWLAVAALLGMALFAVSEGLTDILHLSEAAEAYNRSLFVPDSADAATAAIEILLIGVATAIVEEAGFRGLLHRWIRQKVGRIMGLAFSAAIFSACHFGFVDPSGALGWYWTAEVFVFGVLLALLLEWSGSLWPPILLHAANNAVAVVLAHLAG